jgi:hypothetical protein
LIFPKSPTTDISRRSHIAMPRRSHIAMPGAAISQCQRPAKRQKKQAFESLENRLAKAIANPALKSAPARSILQRAATGGSGTIGGCVSHYFQDRLQAR